jgi:LysR family transcriptional regulator, benzoate and cis,cis-muconate-responsive activator of ben and cat genes
MRHEHRYAATVALDLDQLAAFVAVADHRHFGRAADALGVTQPVVSRRLRALEATVGLTLFERTSRQTSITAHGTALLDAARDTLDRAARVEALARAAQREELRVGFIASTIGRYLPLLAEVIARDAPSLTVTTTQVLRVEVTRALRAREVDLVIARPLHHPAELIEQAIAVEDHVVAVAEGHPLARRERVTLDDLRGETRILLDRRFWPEQHDALLERMREAGDETPLEHAPSYAAAFAYAAAGRGVFVTVRSMAPNAAGLTLVPLDGDGAEIVAIRRPGRAPEGLDRLVAGLAEAAAQPPR